MKLNDYIHNTCLKQFMLRWRSTEYCNSKALMAHILNTPTVTSIPSHFPHPPLPKVKRNQSSYLISDFGRRKQILPQSPE